MFVAVVAVRAGDWRMAHVTFPTSTVDETIDSVIDDGFMAHDRAGVTRYLRENPDLLPVLGRIKAGLEPPLATEEPLRLELAYDPEREDDPPRLWVRIPTALEAEPAIDALDTADRSWWLAEHRQVGDRLGPILDFV
jgi:hypothetical protein